MTRETPWQAGESAVIECNGKTVTGRIRRASPNGVSLVLEFEAALAGHLGIMPVLLYPDGRFRSLFGEVEVTLSRQN